MKLLRPLWIVLALVVVVVVVWVGVILSSQPTVHWSGGPQIHPFFSPEVIVGTVKAVSAGAATNGNPARVTFEITETLKGQLKGTVVVVWQGPGNDIDYTPAPEGVLERWAATPAEKPKVGDAYILFGRFSSPTDKSARESQWFYASDGGRVLDTAENRQIALAVIKVVDDAIKAGQDRQAAEAARHDAEVKEWRAGMTDAQLAAAVNAADFVALGKFNGNMTFKITELLKGRKRYSYTDDSYYVQFKATKEVAALVTREREMALMMRRDEAEYVVLLSEKGLVLGYSTPIYRPVGDGVVLADAATIERVRELTKGLASKGPPAVFVYPDDPAVADALEAAAGGKVTVIRGQGFGVLPLDRVAANPGVVAEFLLRVDRYPWGARKPLKLELAKRDAIKTLLVDTTLPEPDEKALAAVAADIIAAILKAE